MEALVRVFQICLAQFIWISCQAQEPQHTFDFQPNYYSFQSIGTNELPPQIAGNFNPTGVPNRLVSSPSPTPDQIRSLSRPTPPPFGSFAQPQQSQALFQEVDLPKPSPQVLAQQNEIVPILPPNPTPSQTTPEPPPVEYEDYDYEQYDYNTDYSDYDYQEPIGEASADPQVFVPEPPFFDPGPPFFGPEPPVFIPEPPVFVPEPPPVFVPEPPVFVPEPPPVIIPVEVPPPPSPTTTPTTTIATTHAPTVISTLSTTVAPPPPPTYAPQPTYVSQPSIHFTDDQYSVPSYSEPIYSNLYGYEDTYRPPYNEEPEFRDEETIIETLPAETSLQDPNLQCYERTCDQNITGRDLSYERALEIIQTEEYLTAADIDLIIKKKKKRSVSLTKFRCSNGFNVLDKKNCRRIGFDLSNIFPFSLFTRGPLRGPFRAPSVFPSFPRRPRFRFRPPPNPIVVQNVLVDPPIVPINVAQPGEPGGGGLPSNFPDSLDLVPRGLEAVTAFPPYLFPRTVPALCVIFLENQPKYPKKPEYPHHSYGYPKPHYPIKRQPIPLMQRVKNYLRSIKRTLRRRDGKKSRRVKREDYKGHRVHLVEVPAFERRYGFRCRVTLVDKQQCQLGVSCDSEGNRLTDRLKKRQTGEEFIADGPPECRTELSPLGCTPAIKLASSSK